MVALLHTKAVIYYLIFCECTSWNFASNWFGYLAGFCNGMHSLLLNSNHWSKSSPCPHWHLEILQKYWTALQSKQDHPKYASTHPSAWLYFRLWTSIFILAFQFRALQWYPGRIWYKSKVCRSAIDAEALLRRLAGGTEHLPSAQKLWKSADVPVSGRCDQKGRVKLVDSRGYSSTWRDGGPQQQTGSALHVLMEIPAEPP